MAEETAIENAAIEETAIGEAAIEEGREDTNGSAAACIRPRPPRGGRRPFFHSCRLYLVGAWLAALLVACADGGGCAGADVGPLPQGQLPAHQTVEGAAQLRVTPAGLERIGELVPPIANDLFADGICVPRQAGSFLGGDYEFCHRDDCVQSDGNPGCQLDVELTGASAEAEDDSTLRLGADLSGEGEVPARGWGQSCTFEIEGDELAVAADIRVDIDERTGELDVGLAGIPAFDLSGLDIEGCGALSDLASLVTGAVSGYLVDLFSPLIDDFVQGLLPDPLGVEGAVDATPLFADLRPQTDVLLEVRAAPGGHADLAADGLNIGLIAGLNTDFEPGDRSVDSVTTPSSCVPPLDPPDLSAGDRQLPRTDRFTFALPAAGAFAGDDDPDDRDVLLGVSETALDLAGYHAFASGALCLGIDAETVPQLSLGTLGVLVPSLAELGSERRDDPLMLVTRPRQPIDVSIEDGDEGIDATLHVRELELDLYAFVFERWIRAFSLEADFDLGLGAELVTGEDDRPAVLPTLAGLEAERVEIDVKNTDLLREDRESLKDIIPALLDLAVPAVSGGLGSIALPDVAGFTLTGLDLERVETEEDRFLAVAAQFGRAAVVDELAEAYPALRDRAAARPAAARAPARAETRAELARVDAPAPDAVRAALGGGEGEGALPEVVIDVDPYDEDGRPLEWTWRLRGGLWRPFTQDAPLVIRDRAFAIPGRYDVDVRARVQDDYRTVDLEPISIPVVVDGSAPVIHAERARVEGDELVVPVTDAVTPADRIERALAAPRADAPATSFSRGPLDRAEAEALAGGGGDVRVFARDEAGNTASARVHARAPGAPAGCGVAGGQGGAPAALALGLILATLAAGPRGGGRPTRSARRAGSRARCELAARAPAAAVGAAALALALAGIALAGCGSSCAEDADCEGACEGDDEATCTAQGCLCGDDVPLGDVGAYSALALGDDGTAWISAYNDTYGDLMVARAEDTGRVTERAWRFVDGVPDGPVEVENATRRGGVLEGGPDVGLYTDIAVASADRVFVSYYDRDTGSLRVAVLDDEEWSAHAVDDGGGGSSARAGLHTALTLDADGRPGVAYAAVTGEDGSDQGSLSTEVRFARARKGAPEGEGDWDIEIVDRATRRADESDPTPIGAGLDVTAGSYADGGAVVAYYDRERGALRVAEEGRAGAFGPPTTLDTGDGFDVGRHPSLALDRGQLHITYMNETRSKLLYRTTSGADRAEIVDDGLRDGDTLSSELRFVGADSSLVIAAGAPVVAYQDGTGHELVLAERGRGGEWTRRVLAGDDAESTSAYGFFASAAAADDGVTVSSWVLDRPQRESWVELHRRAVGE